MAAILLLSCLHSRHVTIMIPAGVEFTRVQEFPPVSHVGLDPAGCSSATAPPKPQLMTAIRATIITDFAAQKISANHMISTNFLVRKQPFADANAGSGHLETHLGGGGGGGGSADGGRRGRRHAVGNLQSASVTVAEISHGKHGRHSYAFLATADLAHKQIDVGGGKSE